MFRLRKLISLEEIINQFGTNRITDCVCVINHAYLLSKILYENIIGFRNLKLN